MASTNKTNNFNLSQFIETDKPTFLGDYNTDMNKIDDAMQVNKLASENNNNSIGNLQELNTQNKLNLVNAVNEVNSSLANIDAKINRLDNNVTDLIQDALNAEWLVNDLTFNNSDYTLLNAEGAVLNTQSVSFNVNKKQFSIGGVITINNYTKADASLNIELAVINLKASSKTYNVGYVIDEENNTVSDLIMEMFDNKIKFNTIIKTGTTSPTNLKIVIVDAVRNV